MRSRPWAKNLDMYRKIPLDMVEDGRQGGLFSLLALTCITLLVFFETRAFFQIETLTDLTLDRNPESKLQVDLNVTMTDLKCEYASVDVYSSFLGSYQENVTQNIHKWSINAEGVRDRYHGRNKKQHDIVLKDERIEESLHEIVSRKVEGADAVSLDEEGLVLAMRDHRFVLVEFYAMWCSHCRDLMPTWETLAEVMKSTARATVAGRGGVGLKEEHYYDAEEYASALKVELPVLIAKVDCVENEDLCRDREIWGYPTIKLFVDGEEYEDYDGDRTILAFTSYLASVEEELTGEEGDDFVRSVSLAHEMVKEEHQPLDATLKDLKTREDVWRDKAWAEEDDNGCEISGSLYVDRTPGHFHIRARSAKYDIVPHMTNLSHVVNHLSFGAKQHFLPKAFPPAAVERLNPVNGNVYITEQLHQAYHHHLKIVTTYFDRSYNKEAIMGRVYQLQLQSHLSEYPEQEVPEVKLSYDLSPIAVSYRQSTRRWYDYITHLMAIVGGIFTIVGMCDSMFRVLKRKRNGHNIQNKNYRAEMF